MASFFSSEARCRVGFKVMVKNYSKDLGESEFYSIFVRKGEVVSCEMGRAVGYVTFKTKAGAENAVKTLDGTRSDTDGDQTLSVKEVSAPGGPCPPGRSPPCTTGWARRGTPGIAKSARCRCRRWSTAGSARTGRP